MITRIIREVKGLVDDVIADQAQKLLQSKMAEWDKQEKPYGQSRIGFGATLRKSGQGG